LVNPTGRCRGPGWVGWCAPLGLRLLPPPEPAHGDRETSIIKKRTPEFRHRDRIRHGDNDGCGKDADPPLTMAGGPRLPTQYSNFNLIGH
jgi:hypothetical protein